MRMNDFFCGFGGMGLGFKQAGFELVGAWDFDPEKRSDIEQAQVKSYRVNVGNHVRQMSVTDMKWYDVPKAELWTFGFPCQDVSIANPDGKGLEGKRSGLFFEIMRLLDETSENIPKDMPKLLLAENVKNLKKHIPIVEAEYKKRGYKLVYTLLNSSFFGVPQDRDRYFLMGIHESVSIQDFKFPSGTPTELRVRDILEPADQIDPKLYLSEKAIAYMDGLRKGKPRWEYHRNDYNGLASTLPAVVYKGVPYGVVKVIGMVEMKGHEVVRRVYDKDGLSPTLTTMEGGHRQPKVDENGIPRKFSTRECARLQGFPDTYEQVTSNTAFYKGMGNAVTVTVAKAIAEEIKKQFGGII